MTEKKNKLFLLDAMALIYRAHFAFIRNPRINSKGFNTSAIFGFVNALLEILEKENPSHIAVAFDSYEPTIRHEDFTEYKANRDKQPEDISLSIPYIKSVLDAFNIPVMEIPGYEADDIIGTIAHKAPLDSFDVFMFTPDKDFAQLVKENVFLFKPARSGQPNEIWDIEKVKEEFGIKRIDQVVEIQGLMGDSVDNIPGVPGIGPKTAKQLIADYDNIENLLANTEKLKGKVKENLENFGDQARLSKKLATLITEAPIDFNESELKINEWNKEAIEQLFAQLEFKNLGKRVLGKEPEVKKLPDDTALLNFGDTNQEEDDFESYNEQKKEYKQLELDSEITREVEKIIQKGRYGMHIELSSPDSYQAAIKSIALCCEKDKSCVIKFSPNKDKAAELLKLLKPLFEKSELEKIGNNLKPASIVLKRSGIHLHGNLFDNLIAHYILDSESRHDLELLSEQYLNYKMLNQGSLSTDQLYSYYCEQADINLQLFAEFKKEIKENHFEELFYKVESPLIEVLADMEYAGVKLNVDDLRTYSKVLEDELQKLEKKIHQDTGVPFNINSPQQLGHVLFEILKLDPNAKKTRKSKQYSTNEEVLRKLAPKHEVVRLVLDYRAIQKLKSTYVDALPGLQNEQSGLIHTTYDQAVAATGRLSSKNPNLQNIPIRTERGRFVRKAFVSRSVEHLLVSADYSQIELRVIAHTSQDEGMMEAFNLKQDIHTSTASKVFGVPLDKVNPDMRRKAKEVNFGIIYGISAWGLAQRLDIPRSEGSEIINHYFTNFPRIKEYIEKCQEDARKLGYAETILHRRRYLRDINSRSAVQRSFAERNAVNAPIQGSAADIIKIAMVKIHREFKRKKLESMMIMQVHDELIFDVVKGELEQVESIVRENMENAYSLSVPLTIDLGKGNNWLEAH
ncbi:MAG: DNA polymerase I [Bacteroidetes bacterium]|nr:DNA polymerase I [Bacteroidota bacterium]